LSSPPISCRYGYRSDTLLRFGWKNLTGQKLTNELYIIVPWFQFLQLCDYFS